MKKTKFMTAIATIGVSAMLLSGCSAGSADVSADGGPVTLNFWSWAPNTQKLVDTWNAANPDIQVKYTDAGGGKDSSAKLLTASRAGNAPDVAAVEYPTLPSLIVADVPLDITELVSDVKDKYDTGTLSQTTFDGQIYGLPQDIGPMAYFYRSDLLEKWNIPVPTTWAEFKTAAAAVRAADPKAYLASLPADQWAFYAGVANQAGSKWWSVSDNTWTVGIADEASLQVADYFQDLVDEDLISTDPILTPEWNAKVNSGTILSWPGGLWAPGVIEGVAADTVGKWSMAAFPQWTAGDASVAYQGGSAEIVTKNSKHPEQAAEFIKWLNASDEGANLVLTVQNAYPAAISGQEAAKSSKPPALMPQQDDFYELAATISSNAIPVTWGPNVNVAESAFADELNKAITAGTSWRDAFKAVEKIVVADMTKSGFEISNK